MADFFIPAIKSEFRPNLDACPICMAFAGVGDFDKCPVKVRDTDPNCRCSVILAESEGN